MQSPICAVEPHDNAHPSKIEVMETSISESINESNGIATENASKIISEEQNWNFIIQSSEKNLE